MYLQRSLIHGVGINDANYIIGGINTDGSKWWCPFYDRWVKMIRRCYSEKYQKKRPTYKGCSVCKEWLTFSNFKRWMEQQDWVGKHLDKDLLVQGNKVYSPFTCIFVSQKINSLLVDCGAARGEWPLGVSFIKERQNFRSRVNINGKLKHIGYFLAPEVAHKAWQKAKAKLIKEAALEQTDTRVRDALLLRASQLEDDITNNRETMKL